MESRILITRNSKDSAPLVREWAEAGWHHAGCILVWSVRNHEFGRIVEGVDRLLARHPAASDWADLAIAL